MDCATLLYFYGPENIPGAGDLPLSAEESHLNPHEVELILPQPWEEEPGSGSGSWKGITEAVQCPLKCLEALQWLRQASDPGMSLEIPLAAASFLKLMCHFCLSAALEAGAKESHQDKSCLRMPGRR